MVDKVDLALEIEAFAATFERARALGQAARVEDFLPPRDHSAYGEIGVELLRIDLELASQGAGCVALEDYQRRFPVILNDPERLNLLAFEHYRQRAEMGHSVRPAEYARQYGVDVSGWAAVCLPGVADVLSPLSKDYERANADRVQTQGRSFPPAFPQVGQRHGEFDLVEELGRGAFARVFLAKQTTLANRPVALKISPGSSIEPDRLAQLQHANIVPIYSLHQDRDFQAVCMPYLGRTTLAHVMGETIHAGRRPRSGHELLSTIVAGNDRTLDLGSPPASRGAANLPTIPLAPSIRERFEGAVYVDAVVWISAQLASGLAHAHERDILHRDLKPANVLFSDDGRPMILDFNLSEQATRAGVNAAVGGTLPYMSPEQLQSLITGEWVDARSDIYSLGVILFEMLTGRLPFDPPVGASADSLAAAVAVRRAGSVSVRTLNRETPASIAGVVARCLAPDPAARYQSAGQLREDLQRHLDNRPLAHAPDRAPRERIRKWKRRHPRLASVAAVSAASLLVISAMTAAWLMREDHFARVEANSQFQDFALQVHEARLPLSLPGVDYDAHREGVAAAKDLLRRYGVLENELWRQSEAYLRLAPEKQRALDREVVQVLHALAGSALKLAAAEDAVDKRTALLAEASRYNENAAALAPQATPGWAAAIQRQQSIIESCRTTAAPPAPADVIHAAATLDSTNSKSILLLQQHRYADALSALIKARDEAPTSLSAWMLVAVAHAGMGNHVEAEECLTACIRLRPQFPFSYFQRGLARHQMRKFSAAARDFSKYLELRGASSAALINRALAYHALGEHPQALEDLNSAEAAGARQTRMYFIRAAVRRQLQDVAGAQDDYRRGLASTPVDPASWSSRGMAQLKRAPEKALVDFRRALELDPANRTAVQNAVHVLSDRLGRNAEALELLDRLIASNPQDAYALLSRAVIRGRLGNAEGAEADAAAALKIVAGPRQVFQAACALSQASRTRPGLRDAALRMLARSIGDEPALASVANNDPDLAPLRESEEFERLMTAADVISSGGAAATQEVAAHL